MSEEVFLSERGVIVTRTRFVVPGQTYAISGITSVAAKHIMPSRTWPIVMIVVGVVLLLAGFRLWPVLLLGLVVGGAGVVWLLNMKPKYYVVLTTAAGETRALASEDQDWINHIVDALTRAIVARG